ncbi:thiamine phosphate synthase [Enhygromyxa salina]|uniref:Thiamine-phosphate synthase n=1 Tax=Enhygromyxa salina TaxID=215803 RepID=A0A2S9YWB6_9BACT|nr:thiamine phosphate synthase [Enhygromyxa salina]PRQ09401.1 Thiamine-phosphate synthase [Enhygromyxa salina]
MNVSGLYAILDLPDPHQLDPEAVLNALIDGGAGVIQLRSKHAPLDEDLAVALGRRCAAAELPLILNDELELAARGIAGVAGVHLGQGDLARLGSTIHERSERRSKLRAAGLWLGVSTHDLRQLRAAIDELAPDYVGFGPVFSTSSKPDHDPVVGLDALARACAASPVPVVAIGGVQLDNAKLIARCGAAAIASIGALRGPSVAMIRERSFALAQSFAQ